MQFTRQSDKLYIELCLIVTIALLLTACTTQNCWQNKDSVVTQYLFRIPGLKTVVDDFSAAMAKLTPPSNYEYDVKAANLSIAPADERVAYVIPPDAMLIPDEPHISGTFQARSDRSFYLQQGSPRWMRNFSRPGLKCKWTGVGGQAFNLAGEPLNGLIVEVGGSIEGQAIEVNTITGLAPAFGPGGFELTLADHVVESSQSLWIRLREFDGRNLTAQIAFDTRANCYKNLVLINFHELDPNNLGNAFVPFQTRRIPEAVVVRPLRH